MDNTIINVEDVAITMLVVGLLLWWLFRVLRRSRPEFKVGVPLAAGYVLRLLVVTGVALTGAGQSLRDAPDEQTWLAFAHQLAHLPFSSSQWLPTTNASYLHPMVLALQMKLLGSPTGALRITQIGIAMAGLILIVAAVHDQAGGRAARLAAWLVCLEPAGLLFDGLLLKEPLMELAAGLVVFGATKVWNRLELRGIVLMGIGGLIALGTRQYVGWFLITCAVFVILHASLRGLSRQDLRALPLIYAVALIALVGTPAILTATTSQSLQENLQPLQTGESTASVSTTQAHNHLALGPVNFSTRAGVITNLPTRIRDVLLRPYPWQVQNLSQALGAVGSLVALTGFFLLIRYAFLSRGEILRRAGPLLYPFLFLLVGYALATGNAGQGFRYRTHLVTIALAALVVLRAAVIERRQSERSRSARSVEEWAARAGGVPAAGRGVPAF